MSQIPEAELVLMHLIPKLRGQYTARRHRGITVDVDIYEYRLQDLMRKVNMRLPTYFLIKSTEKFNTDGYWVPAGVNGRVKHNNEVIGVWSRYKYHHVHPSGAEFATGWFITEYSVERVWASRHGVPVSGDDYVMCKVEFLGSSGAGTSS